MNNPEGNDAGSSAQALESFYWFKSIPTRWMDNDVYGHVNNVTYYSYFDTVVNAYLIEKGGLDIHNSNVVGFVVASGCQYRRPIAFPQVLNVGLRVNQLGDRSVEYGIGIFVEEEIEPAAFGTFRHVFVGRESQRAVEIPPAFRQALMQLVDG